VFLRGSWVGICRGEREGMEGRENVLDYLWGDGLAGTAPGCERIEDNDIFVCDGGAEFVLTVSRKIISI
jgi:hypothetical protein